MIRFWEFTGFSRGDAMRRILCVPCARNFIFRLRRPAVPSTSPATPRFATARHAGLPRRRARRLGQPRRRRPLPRAAPWFRYQDFSPNNSLNCSAPNPSKWCRWAHDHQPAPTLRLVLPSHQDALQDHGGVRRLSVRPLRGRDAGALPRLRSCRGGDPPQTREGEHTLRHDDILAAIRENKDSLATVMLGAVNYYTGQFFDLAGIAAAAHAVGATCGFNLAHATGNVLLRCTTETSTTPASVPTIPQRWPRRRLRHLRARTLRRRRNPAALRRLVGQRPRLPLQDAAQFRAGRGARSWQQSNAPVFSMAALLRLALDVFSKAGMMEPLRRKSLELTAYLEYIVAQINRQHERAAGGDHHPRRSRAARLPALDDRAPERPQGLRSPAGPRRDRRLARTRRDPRGPVPLYNSFEDVYRFGQLLESASAADWPSHPDSIMPAKHITLLGAGLVGSLLSIYLVRRGYKVTVYERRPDMRQANISAASRSTRALRPRLGAAWKAWASRKRSARYYPHAPTACCIRCRASSATSATAKKARRSRRQPGTAQLRADDPRRAVGATIHFNQRCTGIDLNTATARFEHTQTKQESTVTADLVFGSDGAFSAARLQMQLHRPLRVQPALPRPRLQGNSTSRLPRAAASRMEKHALHIWPAAAGMLIALPNLDGSFTCTLFFPFEEGVVRQPVTKDDVMAFFHRVFPDAVPLMPTLAEDFSPTPPARWWPWSVIPGPTKTSSRWSATPRTPSCPSTGRAWTAGSRTAPCWTPCSTSTATTGRCCWPTSRRASPTATRSRTRHPQFRRNARPGRGPALPPAEEDRSPDPRAASRQMVAAGRRSPSATSRTAWPWPTGCGRKKWWRAWWPCPTSTNAGIHPKWNGMVLEAIAG